MALGRGADLRGVRAAVRRHRRDGARRRDLQLRQRPAPGAAGPRRRARRRGGRRRLHLPCHRARGAVDRRHPGLRRRAAGPWGVDPQRGRGGRHRAHRRHPGRRPVRPAGRLRRAAGGRRPARPVPGRGRGLRRGRVVPGAPRRAASPTSRCFSFHGRKGITAGEGGALTTDDARVGRRRPPAAHLRRRAGGRGQRTAAALPLPSFAEAGYNYRLSDVQAAHPARPARPAAHAAPARRREVARAYGELLAGLEQVELPWAAPGPGAPLAVLRPRGAPSPRPRRRRARAAGPRHRLHHRHLRLAPAARLRPAEAAAGLGRPLRPSPGDPDARQPDRPRRSPGSRRPCARSSRCPTCAR